MGVGKLNIFLSDVANPCGTFNGHGAMTILDCNGIMRWPCGRFRNPDGKWERVSRSGYVNLPFKCGHLEVELPPGCYWVVAATSVTEPEPGMFKLNETSHVGIVQVRCDETACVKLYNPSTVLCWTWFRMGLEALRRDDRSTDRDVQRVVEIVEENLIGQLGTSAAEQAIIGAIGGMVDVARGAAN
ncbi:MAG: hypothetical protein QNJ16_17355 [Rhodobacter sp.]|nr:hypothetical protein [Rhodobacter sp.]